MPKTDPIPTTTPPKSELDISHVPECGSRWIHKDCKRIVIVAKTEWFGGSATLWACTVTFRYESGTHSGSGFRRHQSRNPEQIMKLDEWRRLFTEPAPPKKES